jgi:hypothetical protein
MGILLVAARLHRGRLGRGEKILGQKIIILIPTSIAQPPHSSLALLRVRRGPLGRGGRTSAHRLHVSLDHLLRGPLGRGEKILGQNIIILIPIPIAHQTHSSLALLLLLGLLDPAVKTIQIIQWGTFRDLEFVVRNRHDKLRAGRTRTAVAAHPIHALYPTTAEPAPVPRPSHGGQAQS